MRRLVTAWVLPTDKPDDPAVMIDRNGYGPGISYDPYPAHNPDNQQSPPGLRVLTVSGFRIRCLGKESEEHLSRLRLRSLVAQLARTRA